MSDDAELLFDQLRSKGAQGVRDLIARDESERLLLDFKRLSGSSTATTIGKDDKENYAKALSGFANSSGGVLIWGVDARRNTPLTSMPIPNVLNFRQQLESLLPVAVTRAVHGVENMELPLEDGSGYVVTFVPESASAPHRAEFNLQRYFRRVGDSFLPMEHYEIEDMFGRRQRPLLSVTFESTLTVNHGGQTHEYEVSVVIQNDGRAMAMNYGIDLEFPRDVLRKSVKVGPVFRQYDHPDDPQLAILRARSYELHPIFPGERIKAPGFAFRLDSGGFRKWDRALLSLTVFTDHSAPIVGDVAFASLNTF